MTTYQDVLGPAEIYDTRFVPALFAQWGPIVAAQAGIRAGSSVLDVACGTGALALAAAEVVGPSGSVVGLDASPDMLAVARRKPGRIEWREGRAEALPFLDESFDAVASQFGFMFFEDKPRALAEMLRVLKPDGQLAVAVCDDIARSPGYDAFARLLDGLFGPPTGDAFRAPFLLGDASVLRELARRAEIVHVEITRHRGWARFPSIDALVSAERACAWTLGGMLDDGQFERLREASHDALAPFVDSDGAVAFEMPALVLRAGKARLVE